MTKIWIKLIHILTHTYIKHGGKIGCSTIVGINTVEYTGLKVSWCSVILLGSTQGAKKFGDSRLKGLLRALWLHKCKCRWSVLQRQLTHKRKADQDGVKWETNVWACACMRAFAYLCACVTERASERAPGLYWYFEMWLTEEKSIRWDC